MVILNLTERQTSIEEIKQIEELIGYQLPEEYKLHLLKYNGGMCEPNVFSFKEDGEMTSSCLHWFLAIYNGEGDNLRESIETFKLDEKRMPQHIIPIAHDPGGNQICISCDGQDKGAIYFWDHENEVDYSVSDDNDYSNLYFIASSFNEFLESLTADEEDDE